MSINEVMDTMISDGIEWRKRIHVAELTNLVEDFFFFFFLGLNVVVVVVVVCLLFF